LSLSAKEISRLRRIVELAEKLIAETPRRRRGRPASIERSKPVQGKRVRRSGKELIRFRKMLKTQRQNGVPVAELARRHGISSAYIYLLP
jgi:hypothetical protein